MNQKSAASGKGTITGNRYTFAPRMAKTPKSFIREILKVTERPEIISFAGGLPDPPIFPVEQFAQCADVLREQGRSVLQYGATEGLGFTDGLWISRTARSWFDRRDGGSSIL